ncbi:Uncharacterised protein [BD1-7 clade bacterium]|uniref:Uncharacterized protein n=1 Tax=BD1-7 clade bacterium TaxID=2029982 RepID=A0A5S9Q9X3_9GAMM|nr:Uncharacterised protein [BD1-7 clade bacterium]CAA0113944.1 Uncharacterised protein [BD1-7 clade bacterium]
MIHLINREVPRKGSQDEERQGKRKEPQEHNRKVKHSVTQRRQISKDRNLLSILIAGFMCVSIGGCDNDASDDGSKVRLNVETPAVFADVQLTSRNGVIARAKTNEDGIAELVVSAEDVVTTGDTKGMLVRLSVDANNSGRYLCMAEDCGSFDGELIHEGELLPRELTQGLSLLNYRYLKPMDSVTASAAPEFETIQVTYLGALAAEVMKQSLTEDPLTVTDYSTQAEEASQVVVAALNMPLSTTTDLQTWKPATADVDEQENVSLTDLINRQMSRSFVGIPAVSDNPSIMAVVLTEQLSQLGRAKRLGFQPESISAMRGLAINHKSNFGSMRVADDSSTAAQMAMFRQQQDVDMERLLHSVYAGPATQ